MKSSILFLLLSASLLPAAAQVAINSDGATPDASAMLEVTSTNSGVLIPRLTAAQRDAIPTPATGLMVYVTDNNLFHFYNGTAWVAISTDTVNPTDELQTLSRSGTDVTLSQSGGTVSIADNDNDSSNELQTLSKTGTDVTLSNGGGTISIADNDNSPSNELQTLSLDGQIIRLTNGGSVDLGVNDLASKWSTANGAIHHNSGEVGIGTNNPDVLLHLSSATVGEATGFKLTQGTFNSLLYHNNAGDLHLRKQGIATQLVLDNLGNIGVGTDAPSQALDINGQIRIRGGNPGAGKVLTASNNNGEAAWTTLTGVQLENSQITTVDRTSTFGAGTGWKEIGGSPQINGLSQGDTVLVLVSFGMQLNGGSGTDTTRLRIKAENVSGSGTQFSMESQEITNLFRGDWMLYSFHRVMTINQGGGNYQFRLQVDESLHDDPLRVDQMEFTVIKIN